MGFYVVPLKHISLLFHLSNFLCVWSPFHMMQVLVPLASGVYPLVCRVGSGACADFLVGEAGAFPLVSGVGSFPSPVQDHVKRHIQRLP